MTRTERWGRGGITQTPEHWPFVGDTGRASTGVAADAAREKTMKRETAGLGGGGAEWLRLRRNQRYLISTRTTVVHAGALESEACAIAAASVGGEQRYERRHVLQPLATAPAREYKLSKSEKNRKGGAAWYHHRHHH